MALILWLPYIALASLIGYTLLYLRSLTVLSTHYSAGAFDNLTTADHDRYVHCLETAQRVLESPMATIPSDVREELRRDLVDATPLLFDGAVDHCMASLDRAMDRLIMLYQCGKGTNGAVSDKVEQAKAILRRAGGGSW